MLDVRRLRVLRELAARGTIAATADALGYTAPAVSQQLATLEKEAGVALLERNGRRRRLTPAGAELVARTEGILRELEAAEAALARTATHVAGVLRCAAFSSAHRALLPAAIASLAARHPDLRVSTAEMEPEDSLPALKLGELDLAIAQDYVFAPAPADAAVERTDLFDDPLMVALPAAHPLARDDDGAARGAPSEGVPLARDDGAVDLAALEGEPWVAGREGSFCHTVVVQSARRAGYEPDLAHITNDFTVVYALVAAGAGVALVPGLAGPPPPGVVLRPIAGAAPSRRIYAAVRAGSGARPAVAAMLDALTSTAAPSPAAPGSARRDPSGAAG
jgi:DNA-binding transcriptional LysR family regulator